MAYLLTGSLRCHFSSWFFRRTASSCSFFWWSCAWCICRCFCTCKCSDFLFYNWLWYTGTAFVFIATSFTSGCCGCSQRWTWRSSFFVISCLDWLLSFFRFSFWKYRNSFRIICTTFTKYTFCKGWSFFGVAQVLYGKKEWDQVEYLKPKSF